jgi:hypothetical protein
MAYRIIAMQSSGRVSPKDSAGYRIAVTKLDQDNAEVLMELAAYLGSSAEDALLRDALGRRFIA